MRRIPLSMILLAGWFSAGAAELVIAEPEKTCRFEQIGNNQCTLLVTAKGATIAGVKGRVAAGAATGRLTTNELELKDGESRELIIQLRDGTFSGAGPFDAAVLIDSRIGTAVQKPVPVKLTIHGSEVQFSVFNGKPVSLLFTRRFQEDPTAKAKFLLKGTEDARAPKFVGSEFSRTVGEAHYALDSTLTNATVTGEGPAYQFQAEVKLPRGNFTAASGTIQLQTAGGKEFTAPLLCHIKDDWWMPIAALIVGHFVIFWVRRWTQVERPAKVLLVRMLSITEAVRAFELANPAPSEADKERVRKIKALLASARRSLELQELDIASRQAMEAENLLQQLQGSPGIMERITQPKNPPSGVAGLLERIKASDSAIEFVAFAISVLLGATIYFEVTQFGTYNDYLKIFLFAFGISTSTQGFTAVLAQLRTARP